MFNTSVENRFSYNINAVSGTLRKSHPKSKFCVRKISDDQYVFDTAMPKLTYGSNSEIVVLQVMLVGENRALIEYVKKSDFEDGVDNAAD